MFAWILTLFSTNREVAFAAEESQPEIVPCVKNMSFYDYGSAIGGDNFFTGM